MKTEKWIKKRLRKYREEKAKLFHKPSGWQIERLNKQIKELEWVLED